jgi:hypothetical protein
LRDRLECQQQVGLERDYLIHKPLHTAHVVVGPSQIHDQVISFDIAELAHGSAERLEIRLCLLGLFGKFNARNTMGFGRLRLDSPGSGEASERKPSQKPAARGHSMT